jgi:hypothetical protein
LQGCKDQEGVDNALQLATKWVVERRKWSMIEIAEVMILDTDLPSCLWAKACNTTMYILNRCPHKIWKDKTLKEAFIGEKLGVSHFHIFGYPIYILVLDEKRTNLEPSSIKGIFVRYSEIPKLTRSMFEHNERQ